RRAPRPLQADYVERKGERLVEKGTGFPAEKADGAQPYRVTPVWLLPEEIENREGTLYERDSLFQIEVGAIEKMSKSKKNVVDLDAFVQDFGADVARWFVLSDSPPERDVEWTASGVKGAWNFVQRVWTLTDAHGHPAPKPGEAAPAMSPEAHAL